MRLEIPADMVRPAKPWKAEEAGWELVSRSARPIAIFSTTKLLIHSSISNRNNPVTFPTHHHVDDREGKNGPEPAEEGVGDPGSEQRGDIAGPRPCVHLR